MPAVIEASMDMIPLIVLTADRPPELKQTGANQTVEQVKIYGDYVRWFVDMPCPTEQISPRFVLTTVDQAVYRAMNAPSGPVHINCMFREPLLVTEERKDFSFYLNGLESWMESETPFTGYGLPDRNIENEQIQQMANFLSEEKKGIIVVGRLKNNLEQEAVLRLSQKMMWPVMTDVMSGLRLGINADNFIPAHDLMLHAGIVEQMGITSVFHIGGRIVSKRLQQFLKSGKLENYIYLSDHPYRYDPNHRITTRFEADITTACHTLSALLQKQSNPELAGLSKKVMFIDKIVEASLPETDLNGPVVARSVAEHISEDSGLFLANSLAVREMDMFASVKGASVPVGCNRGASGIDGTIASAVGFARGLNAPVTVLLGDLAMLHDLNSLRLVESSPQPIILVVLNNNGGGIFSFLPVATEKEYFETYFGTPHDLTFGKSTAMFGLEYHKPETKTGFVNNYLMAQKKTKSCIIEVTYNRDENFKIHREIFEAVRENMSKL